MTMITTPMHSRADVAFRPTVAVTSLVVRSVAILERAIMALFAGLERARQRRELLSLGDSALKDFGANRCDVAREGNKPFWRA